jgi:hypothetical protein
LEKLTLSPAAILFGGVIVQERLFFKADPAASIAVRVSTQAIGIVPERGRVLYQKVYGVLTSADVFAQGVQLRAQAKHLESETDQVGQKRLDGWDEARGFKSEDQRKDVQGNVHTVLPHPHIHTAHWKRLSNLYKVLFSAHVT